METYTHAKKCRKKQAHMGQRGKKLRGGGVNEHVTHVLLILIAPVPLFAVIEKNYTQTESKECCHTIPNQYIHCLSNQNRNSLFKV